jgi:hypothetical protein
MNIHPAIIVLAYMLIGIFVASVVEHFGDNDDEFFFFVLFTLFWPIVVFALTAWLVLAIPYILGKWVGYLVHDLLR